MRSSFAVFTAVLASVHVAAALPPACLLAALGVQGNPSDLKAVCGTLQHAVQGNLTDNCHKDALPQAYEVYSSKCLQEGVTVAALPTSTSSSSAHSSGTASASGPNSASATPTGTTGDSTSTIGSSSSSSSATPSGNAGMSTEPRPFVYAAAALLATGLTSVVFL